MSRTDNNEPASAGADGGPAFPSTWMEANEHGVQFPFIVTGMTLRDWFAGQALSGLMVNSALIGPSHNPSHTTKMAYTQADNMLSFRNQEGN